MRRGPFHLRSLKNRLALAFFGIAAFAFAIIYFYVVPQLSSNLEQQKLRDLRRVALSSSGTLQSAMERELSTKRLDDLVRGLAEQTESEVTLLSFQPKLRTPAERRPFYVLSNSSVGSEVEVPSALVSRTARSNRLQTEIDTDSGQVQAAEPLRQNGREVEWVAVYARSIDDVADTVSLVGTEVLVATAAALLVALFGGYTVARAMALRVGRLEKAAKEVAAGRFIDPLPVESEDELGQLTKTFNEMQRRLAQLDRARREFIANASHELRTPIFSLGGFVELLQDEDLDEATREEFLGTMRDQVARLQKLATDLLDLSRIDAGSLELSREEVDLAEVARTVSGEFHPALSRHRSKLSLRLPDGEVDAWCDPERVAQIMRILLDNALTHTPEGTRVTVTAARDNGATQLVVADSGPGLDPVAAESVFERFYTADAARGSGLGLAIARELATHMDGQITLKSQPGQTEFTVELPASNGETA
jgi:two-component system, OmpR family, sensor kinase